MWCRRAVAGHDVVLAAQAATRQIPGGSAAAGEFTPLRRATSAQATTRRAASQAAPSATMIPVSCQSDVAPGCTASLHHGQGPPAVSLTPARAPPPPCQPPPNPSKGPTAGLAWPGCALGLGQRPALHCTLPPGLAPARRRPDLDDAHLVVTVCPGGPPRSDVNARTPAEQRVLPGCNVNNQNRVATSENELAPAFLTHTPASGCKADCRYSRSPLR